MTFDEYCIEHNLLEEELPAGFAAWLNLITNGEWDGTYESIT